MSRRADGKFCTFLRRVMGGERRRPDVGPTAKCHIGRRPLHRRRPHVGKRWWAQRNIRRAAVGPSSARRSMTTLLQRGSLIRRRADDGPTAGRRMLRWAHGRFSTWGRRRCRDPVHFLSPPN